MPTSEGPGFQELRRQLHRDAAPRPVFARGSAEQHQREAAALVKPEGRPAQVQADYRRVEADIGPLRHAAMLLWTASQRLCGKARRVLNLGRKNVSQSLKQIYDRRRAIEISNIFG